MSFRSRWVVRTSKNFFCVAKACGMFCTVYLKSSGLDDVERRVADESAEERPEVDGVDVADDVGDDDAEWVGDFVGLLPFERASK